MKRLTLDEVAKATGGSIIAGSGDGTVDRVSRDSRDVGEGTLFFALVGENHDAHKFAGDVIKSGCRALVISDPDCLGKNADGVTAIKVENTTKALQDLAAWYLKSMNITIIGVTGSVGKTTTKDMIAAMCAEKYKTNATKGNYNNHIGTPLTILDFDEDVQVGVLEMGMDKYGEIDFLAKLARPHIAVITTIGSAHMEFFGSRENIKKAKMEIAGYLQSGDMLIVNGDCDLLQTGVDGDYMLTSCGESAGCDFLVSHIEDMAEKGSAFTITNMWHEQRFESPAIGRHNVINATLAVAAASGVGVTMEGAARGLKNVVLTGNRLDYKESDGIIIIDDTYNASPEAMKAAIDQLVATAGERKIAVLGDMFELGDAGPDIHADIGEYALDKGVDTVIGVGDLGQLIAANAGTAGIACANKEKAIKQLKGIVKAGDVVLVKASHAMGMEKIVEAMMK